MGEKTSIEWTDSSYNPWSGCTKVSPGCQQCYAERITERWGNSFSLVRRASDKTFYAPMTWHRGRFIFTASMSDFFHEKADDWRDDVWEVIRKTPQHTYLILTKRPERIAEHLPGTCFWCGSKESEPWGKHVNETLDHGHRWWPWPNVWLGVSVEMQIFTGRISLLQKIQAARRFLSIEPLIGRVDFTLNSGGNARTRGFEGVARNGLDGIDWVIVGGESDPDKPRQMQEDWARLVRDQCLDAGVPFFFKQWGGSRKCECHQAWGCRLLDGVEHNDRPEPLQKNTKVFVK